jgi:hypothetical protein
LYGLLVVLGIFSVATANPRVALAQEASAPVVHEADHEEETDWELVGLSALDVVVLRPFGTLSTIGGFMFFAATAPFVAPTGRIATSWDIFVYGSYDYTFVRPLGEI